MSLAEDFKRLSTPQKIAIIGGGGLATFFLGRTIYDKFSGAGASTQTSIAPATVSGSSVSPGSSGNVASAVDQLAQQDQTFQTSLAQVLASNQQQDQAFQQSITQALAQSKQQDQALQKQQLLAQSQQFQQSITQALAQSKQQTAGLIAANQQSTQQQLLAQSQQFQQAIASIVQGRIQPANTTTQWQPQQVTGLQSSQSAVQSSISNLLGRQQQPSNVSLPAYTQPSSIWNKVSRGNVATTTRSTAQVVDTTPKGKTISGSNYKQVVDRAGGLWQGNKWVSGSYQGNTFVPKK